jgi:hypothetical protein
MEPIETEDDMVQAISDALEAADERAHDDGDEETIRRITTYADAGVLTKNAGLVIRLRDGSEYQVTICRTR